MYTKHKTKRGDNIRRVANAMIAAHASHASAVSAFSTPPSSALIATLPVHNFSYLFFPSCPPTAPTHTAHPITLYIPSVEAGISHMQRENLARPEDSPYATYAP